MTDPSGLRL